MAGASPRRSGGGQRAAPAQSTSSAGGRGFGPQRRAARQNVQKLDMAVVEVYSPPRITKMAKQMGLSTAWALDLTENDPDDGQPLDLSKVEKRRKARY